MIKKTTFAVAAAMTLGLTSVAVAQGFSVGVGPGGIGVGVGVAPYGAYDGYYDDGPVYSGGVAVAPGYYSSPGTVYVERDYNTGYSGSWGRSRSQRFNDRPGNN